MLEYILNALSKKELFFIVGGVSGILGWLSGFLMGIGLKKVVKKLWGFIKMIFGVKEDAG